MPLRILPETQNQALKKIFFLTSEGHLCICAYFQTTTIKFLKKIFFNVWSGKKTCFGAFAHTFRPPETWAHKWCFLMSDAFLMHFTHTSRPPESDFKKRYILTSEVVKNVLWCMCAYFMTTRIKFFKKIFFNVWSG